MERCALQRAPSQGAIATSKLRGFMVHCTLGGSCWVQLNCLSAAGVSACMHMCKHGNIRRR
jgi:hypothetical protein